MRKGTSWSALALTVLCAPHMNALSLSSFHGNSVTHAAQSFLSSTARKVNCATSLTMRKQKASDRRTRRMQRGQVHDVSSSDTMQSRLHRKIPLASAPAMTKSPMASAGWKRKSVGNSVRKEKSAGRGRARKRSALYNSLASYQNQFLDLLTAEYQAEEDEVIGRINASVDDPIALEKSGFALFDLFPERRGNLFSDEVYRLVKAKDATTTDPPRHTPGNELDELGEQREDIAGSFLPPNHKFSSNDVIMLTLQPRGSGDFFDASTLPTNSAAESVEARVLNSGPSYVDVALPGGAFEAAFGPAPNNFGPSGKGDPRLRLRADRFFSNIPYSRMVAALSQITSIPEKTKTPIEEKNNEQDIQETNPYDKICMDELLRETILSTYAFSDPSSFLFHDTDACDLREIARMLSRPPLHNSPKLANQVLGYIQSNPQGIFEEFNGPQMTAIGAALTRRLTLIQGPPGTGKTTVASAIGFGFVHQCRSVSANTKVLACAFSNVGADNLAEQLLRLGLKVVRIGKASGVSQHLWERTLDAAIDKDPAAQKALNNAAWATSQLSKKGSKKKGHGNAAKGDSFLSERSKREVATAAVKASIKASNVASTKALREADVIVCTSMGAADSRLLAACGVVIDEGVELEQDGRIKGAQTNRARTVSKSSSSSQTVSYGSRTEAPDGLPPLSLPFVIVDEACQSVEPANLIPLTSTNTCRSLVLLGDPCQLPPTIRSDPSSPLSVSLMERLAASLPHPVIVTAKLDPTKKDDSYLLSKPTKQAVSLIRAAEGRGERHVTYRKKFDGSILLSVQYRMHPSIASFSSAIFYDELLSSPSFLATVRPFPKVLNRLFPSENSGLGIRFVNMGGQCNERRGAADSVSYSSSSEPSVSGQQTSYSNKLEAEKIVDILKQTLREQGGSSTIGVVTPYNGQVELIKSLMDSDEDFLVLARSLPSPIEVKSVDGYQGRERDIVIFSAVRSNHHANIGFLTDWRRMNVALTRAKSALIVVGDLNTLTEGDRHWAAFGKWCKGMKCIINGNAGSDETPPLS